MRKLLASADRSEIELVRKRLFRAGLRCEVRGNVVLQALFRTDKRTELWVPESDFLSARGLLSRPSKRPESDWPVSAVAPPANC